jgi:hypothetical protein
VQRKSKSAIRGNDVARGKRIQRHSNSTSKAPARCRRYDMQMLGTASRPSDVVKGKCVFLGMTAADCCQESVLQGLKPWAFLDESVAPKGATYKPSAETPP